MKASRGLLRLPAGLYATARSIGQKRSRTGLVSGALRLSLTPDGGFASIGGSGARLFAALFERLFDIVIRRKGNADGGVLASRLLRSRRRDSDDRLRFHNANRRVARGSFTDLRRATFVGNSSKRSDTLEDSTKGFRIEFST